jgi:hypothetical protein
MLRPRSLDCWTVWSRQALRVESIQQREEHWVIADLVGKGWPHAHRPHSDLGEEQGGRLVGLGILTEWCLRPRTEVGMVRLAAIARSHARRSRLNQGEAAIRRRDLPHAECCKAPEVAM